MSINIYLLYQLYLLMVKLLQQICLYIVSWLCKYCYG